MARVGGFYSSNYDQWSVYLNSLDQSLENPSLSLSSSSPSSTSTSLPAYSTIQSVYDQFLLSYPYSIHYWFKYINISSSRYQQTHDIIYSLHRRSTQAAPYSPSLWYGRISYLVNWNQISNQSTEIIRSIFEAIEHLSGHPEAVDVWKLILYNIQIYGSILQIFYCYWRGLSSYSSYLSILSDQFTHFIQKINFSFNFSSQQLSLENAPQPTPQEIPFVVLYYSAVNFYVEKKEIRKDSYLQSAPNEFEKQITRRFYEEGMLSQQELGIWHQYLSYEELSCESSENNYLPGSQFADLSTSQTGSNFLQECFHSELDCLILCDRAQSENEVLKEKVKENRKYDRVIQLYERCLLICASYSGSFFLFVVMSILDIWKRYISWTVRLSQRQNEKKKYYQRALFICHRAISTALREW